MDKTSVRKKNKMQFQNNFDPIVLYGESKGGQIYKFCLDFHHFSKWHSGVYVEFSLLEMCWFDDFFLIWLAHMYSFFLSSVLHNSQAINYVLFNLIFIEQTIFSYYYNIPQVEEFFSCFLFALSLIINCMVIIVMYNHPICKRDITQ